MLPLVLEHPADHPMRGVQRLAALPDIPSLGRCECLEILRPQGLTREQAFGVVLRETRLDLLVRIDCLTVAVEITQIRTDRIGRGGERLVGAVRLHDAAEQVEDMDESLLALWPGLCVERVHARTLSLRGSGDAECQPANERVEVVIRRRACFPPSSRASSLREASRDDRAAPERSSRAGASAAARGAAAPPSASPAYARDPVRSRPSPLPPATRLSRDRTRTGVVVARLPSRSGA